MVFQNRPNITIESLLSGSTSLLQYVEKSVTVSTEARPDVRLFEFIVHSFNSKDEQELLNELRKTLYEVDWSDEPEYFKMVTVGDSTVQVYLLHTESVDVLRNISLASTLKPEPTVLDRNEISLEALFDKDSKDLIRFKGESVALYISGSPAIHLFQLNIYSITEQDYGDILGKLKEILYEKDWANEDYQIIQLGQSKVQVYRLYGERAGIDPLMLIRHKV
ncbi:hypothetical protein EC973_008618 [Apophysomyces ossiformis]|uniref:Uncharacterized protein n=1 Tax=Apophysomyces ossiformis TaxID=679940 RepID=A0A8H7BN16_9FUNG|nr:hypothetical protein EC973_008618 [Apophysomyces ossiformis]